MKINEELGKSAFLLFLFNHLNMESMLGHHLVQIRFCKRDSSLYTLCPWDSPHKNTRMTCYALQEGIIQTKGLTQGLTYSALASRFFTLAPPGKPV